MPILYMLMGGYFLAHGIAQLCARASDRDLETELCPACGGTGELCHAHANKLGELLRRDVARAIEETAPKGGDK